MRSELLREDVAMELRFVSPDYLRTMGKPETDESVSALGVGAIEAIYAPRGVVRR